MLNLQLNSIRQNANCVIYLRGQEATSTKEYAKSGAEKTFDVSKAPLNLVSLSDELRKEQIDMVRMKVKAEKEIEEDE